MSTIMPVTPSPHGRMTRTDSPVVTFPIQAGPLGQDLAVRGDPPYRWIRHIPFDTHLEAQRAQNTRRANRTAAEIADEESAWLPRRRPRGRCCIMDRREDCVRI